MILYHGSDHIIEKPVFGEGKSYNDYGRGFYCTDNLRCHTSEPMEQREQSHARMNFAEHEESQHS